MGSDLELLHRALDTHSKSRGSAQLSPTQGDNRHNHLDELSVSHLSPIQGDNSHNHLDESSVNHDDTTIPPGQPVHSGEGGVTPPHEHEGSQGNAHTSQPAAQTSSSDHIVSATPSPDDADFRHVVSDHERRRIKRCKGMIYGLKHVSRTVDTLLILDSNGRSISSEDIDGNGEVGFNNPGRFPNPGIAGLRMVKSRDPGIPRDFPSRDKRWNIYCIITEVTYNYTHSN